MLVLSRQKDESLIIAQTGTDHDFEVEITIVDVRGDKVRLGINAPRHLTVHRKEIWEAIQRERAEYPEEAERKDAERREAIRKEAEARRRVKSTNRKDKKR